jgi:large subunit ribosomal protein L18
VSLIRKNKIRKQRRELRTRSRIKYSGVPRVSVFRSLNHIYAQVIDDAKQATIASCSTLELKKVKGDKKAQARAVGVALAKKAHELGVKEVVFDRGYFLYHGRLKALAEGLREGGLIV